MKTALLDGFYAVFDIGSSAVKAALIERRGGKDRLAAIESESIKPSAEFPGESEYREHLVQQLKMVASRLPMGEIREFISVFNSRELQVKLIEPPSQVQPDKLDVLLSWEARKLLSPTYRNEPYLFAWRLLKDSPPFVVLAVVPQIILQKHDELYSAAGIQLTGAYAEVFGTLALKEASVNLGLPAISLINLGHASTHLEIFAAGELKFYRFIPSGVGEFSKPPHPGEMEGFAQKIRFSFDYFRAVSKLAHIDEVLLFGGGAASPEFFDYARDYFAPGKVDTLDVSNAIDISPIISEGSELPGPGPRHVKLLPFLPAIGAFRAHASPSAGSANLQVRLGELLWNEKIAKLSSFLPFWIGMIGVLVITIVLLFWRVSLAEEYEELQKKSSITKNQLLTVRLGIYRLQKAQAPKIQVSPREQVALQPFLRSRRSVDEILFLAARKRPPGVRLGRIIISSAAKSEENYVEEEEAVEVDQKSDVSDIASIANADILQQPKHSIRNLGSEDDAVQVEDLGGEILTIQGYTRSYQGLASYAENLINTRVFRRIRQIRLIPKGSEEQRFILKGDLL